MGSCASSNTKQCQEEFSLLKNKVSSIENDKTLKLRVDALIVENAYLKNRNSARDIEKIEGDSNLALLKEQMAAHGKNLEELMKRVDLYQTHARAYYKEHDTLFEKYKQDKENEPVYKMLEIDHLGTVYKQYGRCYKFIVGEKVSIHFVYGPIYKGPMPKLEVFYNLPDGLSFDSSTATISGAVTRKQEPEIYVGNGAGNMAEQLISIEVV